MANWVGVVLAAGKGRRMRSKTPKVLHEVCGKPMIAYALDALTGAGVADVSVVAAPEQTKAIRRRLPQGIRYVAQPRPLGSGHALLQCADSLADSGAGVVVTMGDAPLVRPSTVRRLMATLEKDGAAVAMLTALADGPTDMGRVRRDAAGAVTAVVEAADDALAAPTAEVNAGVYCFRGSWLWPNLAAVKPGPRGEYMLTDLINAAAAGGEGVTALMLDDPSEAMGVNDRLQLAAAEGVMRSRIREGWMRSGVTIIDPPSTFIDAGVTVGQDTVIHPNTHLQGATVVGEDCVIGPGAVVRDSVIGAGCAVTLSVVEEATLESEVDVGPYSHLRPGTYVETGAHVGNFVEIKASRLGRGVKVGHFSYVGDAQVGEGANLGAGLVTCNFDGVNKHETRIGKGALIGSDTMLVAPVTVGAGAVTGAGAVVTRDVPPYRLAVGVPARIVKRAS